VIARKAYEQTPEMASPIPTLRVPLGIELTPRRSATVACQLRDTALVGSENEALSLGWISPPTGALIAFLPFSPRPSLVQCGCPTVNPSGDGHAN
jgi:hypothetical protein